MDEINITNEGFINIGGDEYYVKYVGDELNQLLGNELAELCGINCVTDKVLKIDDDYFYLSYSLNNLGVYESAYSEGINSLNLYDIWNSLEKKYPNMVEKLMHQLIQIFVFDILMMYGDRHLENFGILTRNQEKDFYILDNEYMFCDFSSIRLQPEMGNYSKSLEDEFCLEENYHRFSTLLNDSSSEFYKDILGIYYLLEPSVIEAKLIELKEKYPELISEETIIDRIKMYEENYKMITKILEERRLISGKRVP